MSYSFNVMHDTKAGASALVETELGKVVDAQPVHAADRNQAQAAADALIAMLTEPKEDECVHVCVNGSLVWRGEGEFTAANLSIAIGIFPKL